MKKIYCNSCCQETRHALLAEHSQRFDIEESDGEWYELSWEIWQCQGCEEVCYRTVMVNSYEIDYVGDSDEEYMVPTISFYPPRGEHLALKKRYENIPKKLDSIYAEVIQCLNTESFILCAAGLRSLIEGICKDKVPEARGNLRDILNALEGPVPPGIVKNLHGFRFLGNSALHELEPPARPELALAIEVIEDILNVVYDLDYKSARLFQIVDKRGGISSPGTGGQALS